MRKSTRAGVILVAMLVSFKFIIWFFDLKPDPPASTNTATTQNTEKAL